MSSLSPKTQDDKPWSTTWTARIDRALSWLKWPVAVLTLISTPFLLWACVRLLYDIAKAPWGLIFFALGIVGFFWVWKRFLNRSKWGAWLIHFEHELTHLLFALLTFHAVLGFRATGEKESYVRIRGDGNWLVMIAPYFFPTAAIFLWALSSFISFGMLPSGLALGFAVGYHIVSTWKETHAGQDDLQRLSFRFCWMFLPAANLLVLGLLIAYSHAGSDGVRLFLSRIVHPFA